MRLGHLRDHGAPPRARRARSRRALRPRVRRGLDIRRGARGRDGRGRRARDHGERLDHALRRGRRRPDRPVSRGVPGGGYLVGWVLFVLQHIGRPSERWLVVVGGETRTFLKLFSCLFHLCADRWVRLDRTVGGFWGGRHTARPSPRSGPRRVERSTSSTKTPSGSPSR